MGITEIGQALCTSWTIKTCCRYLKNSKLWSCAPVCFNKNYNKLDNQLKPTFHHILLSFESLHEIKACLTATHLCAQSDINVVFFIVCIFFKLVLLTQFTQRNYSVITQTMLPDVAFQGGGISDDILPLSGENRPHPEWKRGGSKWLELHSLLRGQLMAQRFHQTLMDRNKLTCLWIKIRNAESLKEILRWVQLTSMRLEERMPFNLYVNF